MPLHHNVDRVILIITIPSWKTPTSHLSLKLVHLGVQLSQRFPLVHSIKQVREVITRS
jgi:hypothetical protein